VIVLDLQCLFYIYLSVITYYKTKMQRLINDTTHCVSWNVLGGFQYIVVIFFFEYNKS